MDRKMYNELLRLRQKFKDEGKRTQGRAPLVCSDDALLEIAELCPKKLSDFESVPGIGKSFIENYGEAFLQVILKYEEVPTEKTVSMTTSASDTLKELEKKLVSINRRNRLLYMPKVANKYAFDLFAPNTDYSESIIAGNGSFVTVCDLARTDNSDEQSELSRYKKIVQLLREVNKDLRDKGQNDLYIGYPFVIGRLSGENFDVRAPLALFPVKADKTTSSIRIALDDSRDIVYNTTLILANFKFNNISKPLPTDTIENYTKSSFIKELIDFYEKNDIHIHNTEDGIRKFVEFKAGEFPHCRSGELRMEYCAVLGKFPICSSSIQKDFDEILARNEINALLNDLLLNADEIDYYSDSYAGDMPITVNNRELEISEHNIVFAFSNYAFYKGRLYVSPNATQPKEPPIQVHKIEDAIWSNRSNLAEAKYIVDLLKAFFDERTEDETIGIITFNSSQRDLIDDLIDAECAKNPRFAAEIRTELARRKDGEDIGLFVKNIESVQGDERDVIIFSIGYAKNENGRLIRNFGWLNQRGGENRLNVAISRAKKKVHIVTSFNPAELQVEDMKNDGPRILKKYLEYAFAVSAGDRDAAKQILLSFGDNANPGQTVSFDSDFENQVYDALVEKGYQVDTQIGIGGYSIDLAIKKDGKYILGIECDGRLYHSSKSARERDYHRQKYLESRGWRIHRIWSTNWWKNPQREITKICNVVDSLS